MKKISRNEDVSVLIKNIEDVKKELSVVKSNFNMETDECLIGTDFCSILSALCTFGRNSIDNHNKK